MTYFGRSPYGVNGIIYGGVGGILNILYVLVPSLMGILYIGGCIIIVSLLLLCVFRTILNKEWEWIV